MKAAPIPLFNYRKRQCQAILSDPQELETPSHTSFSYCQQDVSSESQIYPKNKQTNEFINRTNKSADILQSHDVGKTQKPFNKNSLNTISVKGQCVNTVSAKWNGTRAKSSPAVSFMASSHNEISSLGTNSSRKQATLSTLGNSNKLTVTANNKNISGRISSKENFVAGTKLVSGNQYSKYEFSNVCTNRNSTLANTKLNISTNRSAFSVASKDPTQQFHNLATAHSSMSATQRNTDTKIPPTTANREIDESDNMDSFFMDQIDDQTDRKNYHKNSVAENNQTTKTAVFSKDLSLRIFTSTIAMMRSWAAKRENGHFMFEVYGMLDSAIVRDSTGTGKKFVIRDDTSSVTCVFYEIDREMPRLIRGQMCRVVGSVVDKVDVLQVVSVRTAHVDERLVCQAGIRRTQDEMNSFTR